MRGPRPAGRAVGARRPPADPVPIDPAPAGSPSTTRGSGPAGRSGEDRQRGLSRTPGSCGAPTSGRVRVTIRTRCTWNWAPRDGSRSSSEPWGRVGEGGSWGAAASPVQLLTSGVSRERAPSAWPGWGPPSALVLRMGDGQRHRAEKRNPKPQRGDNGPQSRMFIQTLLLSQPFAPSLALAVRPPETPLSPPWLAGPARPLRGPNAPTATREPFPGLPLQALCTHQSRS